MKSLLNYLGFESKNNKVICYHGNERSLIFYDFPEQVKFIQRIWRSFKLLIFENDQPYKR